MTNNWLKLEKYLSVTLVFLIPTQLALHFWPPFAFVFGIRIDYLAPSLYLTDILLLTTLVLWVLRDWRHIFKVTAKHKTSLILVCLFIVINIVFSTSVLESLYKWTKIAEYSLFVFYIFSNKNKLKNGAIYLTLYLSAIAFSIIGIWQFMIGRTTNSPLYFLGERTFSITTPGIALFQFLGRDFLRAYSTFPHPNAFAGYLGVVLILLLGSKFLFSKKIFLLGYLIIITCLLLTFSLTALIGLLLVVISLVCIKIQKSNQIIILFFTLIVLGSLVLPIFSKNVLTSSLKLNKNISERLELSFLSGEMISQRFAIGEGLNTFIINSTKFNGAVSYTWILQPVHNIFLLVQSETGIFGLLLLIYILYKLLHIGFVKKNYKYTLAFLFIVVTGVSDHYWLTLQQDSLLLSLLIGLALR